MAIKEVFMCKEGYFCTVKDTNPVKEEEHSSACDLKSAYVQTRAPFGSLLLNQPPLQTPLL